MQAAASSPASAPLASHPPRPRSCPLRWGAPAPTSMASGPSAPFLRASIVSRARPDVRCALNGMSKRGRGRRRVPAEGQRRLVLGASSSTPPSRRLVCGPTASCRNGKIATFLPSDGLRGAQPSAAERSAWGARGAVAAPLSPPCSELPWQVPFLQQCEAPPSGRRACKVGGGGRFLQSPAGHQPGLGLLRGGPPWTLTGRRQVTPRKAGVSPHLRGDAGGVFSWCLRSACEFLGQEASPAEATQKAPPTCAPSRGATAERPRHTSLGPCRPR